MNDNEKSIIKQYFVGRNFPIDTLVNGMQPLVLEKLGLKSQKKLLAIFDRLSSCSLFKEHSTSYKH